MEATKKNIAMKKISVPVTTFYKSNFQYLYSMECSGTSQIKIRERIRERCNWYLNEVLRSPHSIYSRIFIYLFIQCEHHISLIIFS